MFNKHAYHGYRTLTEQEQKDAEQAIAWLLKKHVKPRAIALLTTKELDRELNAIMIEKELKRVTLVRVLSYKGSPLEHYINNTFPNLKSRDWLFPASAWLGKKPSYGFHVKIEGVENLAKNRAKKLLYFRRRRVIISVSTKKSNITNQQMVGRRIALRAD